MKLSIIVPCYNVEDHIIRCLESLTNQNLNENEFEIIVIDDGSTDNSNSVVEKYIHNKNNIILYSQKNKGLGAVRNRGLKLAKGDYMYFIDSDDYLAFNTLDIILNYIISFDLDLIGFNTNVTKELDLFTSGTKNKNLEIKVTSGLDYMLKNKLHRLEAWWYIIKRDFLLNNNFMFAEGRFFEDILFTLKVLSSAKKFSFIPIDTHRYVKNPNSILNNDSADNLKKLINSYIEMTTSLFHFINELTLTKKEQNILLVHNLKLVSSLNTCFIFFKIIRSNYSIKNINTMLLELENIGAYPFNKDFVNEGFNILKIRISAYIFNHKYLFFMLLYPIRFLYKKKLISLP
jgi:glycosyltransferase involved in cell wall biosynthesis